MWTVPLRTLQQVGLILCIALSALYMRLHLCSLLLGVFKFQRYRQNIVTKFPFCAILCDRVDGAHNLFDFPWDR